MKQLTKMVLTVLALSTLPCTVPVRRDSIAGNQIQNIPQLTAAAALSRSDSGVYFINPQQGWALLAGGLYSTSDGGNFWAQVNRTDLKDCSSIVFVSPKIGWARCDEWVSARRSNSILLTQDGGRSWQLSLELPTPIYAMNFLDEERGFVSSRWHGLEKTTDGGRTWASLDSMEGLNYIYFIDDKRGWAFGGAIWHTDDGGETWKQDVGYESVNDLWGGDFVDSTNGWIVGSDQVWHTTDGETWQRVTNLPRSDRQFVGVDFINRREGWLTLSDGSILHTADGGGKWEAMTSLPDTATALRFTNSREGWVLSRDGGLLHSIDRGQTWKPVPLPPQ